MKKLTTFIGILFSILSYGQTNDSISLKIDYGVKSTEFQEYLSFKNIDYYKISLNSKKLKEKTFTIIAKEYWNKKIVKVDTIIDLSKTRKPKIQSDSLNISVITEKSEIDSLKINFRFKGLFGVTKKYKTTKSNNYSTRDLSNGKETKFKTGTEFPLLVYSLPYKDPKYPGYLFYCELSREGIPPELWGEKFNLEHYIVFEMKVK